MLKAVSNRHISCNIGDMNKGIVGFADDIRIMMGETWSIKGLLQSKIVESEIFLPVKELVLIDKYTPSIRFWSLSLFC